METMHTEPSDLDDDEEWIRQLVRSEEYLLQHHPRFAGGYYRRFESPNVIDLVRIRRQRARAQLKAS
jgi:hypothetical protein